MVELVYCVFIWLACSVAFSLVLPGDIAIIGVTVSMALYAAVRLSARWMRLNSRPTYRTLERTQSHESPSVRQAGQILTDADWQWLGMRPPAQLEPPQAKQLEGPR